MEYDDRYTASERPGEDRGLKSHGFLFGWHDSLEKDSVSAGQGTGEHRHVRLNYS